jgi:hypothetical protein
VLLKQGPAMQIAQRLRYAMQYRCRYAPLTIARQLNWLVPCPHTHRVPEGHLENLFVRIIEGRFKFGKLSTNKFVNTPNELCL